MIQLNEFSSKSFVRSVKPLISIEILEDDEFFLSMIYDLSNNNETKLLGEYYKDNF